MKEGQHGKADFSTVTEFLVLSHAGLILLGTVAGIFYLIFAELKTSNFVFAGRLIAIGSLIVGVVWLCKSFWDFVNRVLKVKDLTKYRNDYLIAFGSIGICSVVLRISVYFVEFSYETTIFTALVYLITTAAIYCFFVAPTFDTKCTWKHIDQDTSEKFVAITGLVHFALLVVSIRIAVEYDSQKAARLILCQFGCSFASAITFAEFAYVLLIGVRLIRVNGRKNKVTKQSVELKKVKARRIPEPKPLRKPVAPNNPEEDLSELSALLASVQAGLIGLGIAAGVLYLIFAELKASNFIFAGYVIAVLVSIIGVVWLCKLLVDFVHRKLKVGELTKYRNDLLIGFGIMGIFSVVLKILAYFPQWSRQVIYFAYPVYFFTLPYVIISVVHFITVPVIYYFFVYQTLDKKCTRIQMDGKTFDMFIWKNVLINVVLLIVCIRIAVEYNDMKMREVIIWLQLFWTFPAAVNFAEFARVWLFGVRLINVDGERNEVTKQSVESKKSIPEPEPQSKLLASKPTCNICSAAYTETGIRTPRIIKECGHTICEQCASKLLNVKCQNLLECPFCQKPTIVNGPAETLPKNFALLEQIESVQKIPMLSVKPNVSLF